MMHDGDSYDAAGVEYSRSDGGGGAVHGGGGDEMHVRYEPTGSSSPTGEANPFEGGAPPSETTSFHADADDGAAPVRSSSPRSMASNLFSSFQSRMPAALQGMELPSSADQSEYFAHSASLGSRSGLHKVLGWKELVSLGVGCTIGAGIFVVTGVVAATKAGPALFLCYIVAGIACAFAGLCYSEMAAMAPSAGSAYSYARGSMGQTIGWIIGWDLVLEYAVSAASVAQGWSKYFNALLHLMGLGIPSVISQAPWAYDSTSGEIYTTGAILDLPAMFITILITWLLIRGMAESARVAKAMVVLKVGIVLFVILVGMWYTHPANMEPFMPYGFFSLSFFGYTAVGQTGPDGSPVGVVAGSAIVFFSYIGFDAVTCQAEECKNPQRDLPIGIIGSLAISTVLYVGISLVLVGMVPYNLIDLNAPISAAFGALGMRWAEFLIALGAIVGITSVLLVSLMGQPRILMSMARDGLLPESFFAAVHPRFGTPWKSTALTGVVVSLMASLVPLSVLVELVSIGTLLAFTIVCVAILVLRRTAPDVPRPFRVPWVPWIPLGGSGSCLMMMISLPSANWIRLIVWLGIGMGIYVLWGHANAKKVMDARARARGAAGEMELANAASAGASPLAGMNDDATAAGGEQLDPPSSLSFSRNVFEQSNDALSNGHAEEEEDHLHLHDASLHETSDHPSNTAASFGLESIDDARRSPLLQHEHHAYPVGTQQQHPSSSSTSSARQGAHSLLRDQEELLSDELELQ